MSTVKERVDLCFLNVFPDLKKDQLASASATSLAAWDSIAHVTLLSSLSEEFGFDFEMEDFEELTSYSKIIEYLQKKFPDA
jgi:acyl carrier protein